MKQVWVSDLASSQSLTRSISDADFATIVTVRYLYNISSEPRQQDGITIDREFSLSRKFRALRFDFDDFQTSRFSFDLNIPENSRH